MDRESRDVLGRLVTGKRTSTVDHTDVTTDSTDVRVAEGAHQLGNRVGHEHRVGVHAHHYLTPRRRNAVVQGAGLATIALRQRVDSLPISQLRQDGSSLVGGAIVDQDDLQIVVILGTQAAHAILHHHCFVEARHDHRNHRLDGRRIVVIILAQLTVMATRAHDEGDELRAQHEHQSNRQKQHHGHNLDPLRAQMGHDVFGGHPCGQALTS